MTTYDVTIFGIHLKLNPVAFTIPLGSRHWDIYWYGIIIATGFLLALIYGMKNAKRLDLNPDKILDVILVSTPIAILSARTYYVLFDGEKLNSVGEFFGFGNSSGFAGLAIYGGIIGAVVTAIIMCKIKKVNILDLLDLASCGFLIGQGIGRWGNFMNQEAYGSLTGSSWWGMESNSTIAEMGKGMVHPCFLYESIWCIIGFFILYHFVKKRVFKGEIILMYCTWYGFGRGFIELLRTDSLYIGNIKVSSLLSFIICIASAVTITVMLNKKKDSSNDVEYQSVFNENEESDSIENNEQSKSFLPDDFNNDENSEDDNIENN